MLNELRHFGGVEFEIIGRPGAIGERCQLARALQHLVQTGDHSVSDLGLVAKSADVARVLRN